jgi:hypothetical protein
LSRGFGKKIEKFFWSAEVAKKSVKVCETKMPLVASKDERLKK